MADSLIFVSCGQLTSAEKTLGLLIKAVIDGTPGFKAYFAETVQDLETLGHHVMDGIRRCAGAVVVLHDRGVVLGSDGSEWGHRSSVWVNQEVAILAYRQFFEGKRIALLAFAEPNLKLEGAMTSLIANPRPLTSAQDVDSALRTWLAEEEFGHGADDVFAEKWSKLADGPKKVIAALLEEGAYNVKEAAVRQSLVRMFGMERQAASHLVRESHPYFTNTDLVKLIHDIYSGDELSVTPTWEFHLRRRTVAWLADRTSM